MSLLRARFACLVASVTVLAGGCAPPPQEALMAAEKGPGPVVKFDVFHLPLPEIPLPNNFATRFDASSPTLRRLNASIIAAPTKWEQATRRDLDELTGWGTLAPISVAFSEPLDVEVIYQRHHGDLYAFDDDAVLVLDVTPGSPGLCDAVPLDLGQGNYPEILPRLDVYADDPRESLQQLQFEEVEEDLNQNGLLDPGEDTDMDGVLDHPNTRDGKPGSTVLEFYERETNTLIMKPIMPMREATTYAVVLTKRLTSTSGDPVRSPFDGINHAAQTHDLDKLGGCLSRYGLALSDVSFTWTFSTQSISHDYVQVRDGLYGKGQLAKLATDFPADVTSLHDLRDPEPGVNLKIVPGAQFEPLLIQLAGGSDAENKAMLDALHFVDFHVVGEVSSPQFFPRNDASGKPLSLYDQVWDLDAPPRAEAVPFWLFVPKNRKGPAPVVVFVHGHGGSKFSGLEVAGLFARYGVATLAIDAPGHGVSLEPDQIALVKVLFGQAKLQPFGEALLEGRALDFNGDGKLDPGADYWTSAIFHTRDNVRQTQVDLMQVVRVLRGFDGKRSWTSKTGLSGLAGDFDGDGTVDVGGDAPLTLAGGSLGGIITGVGAAVEPQFTSGISIVPGGMLSEIGPRSALGGVRNAMVLRVLAPLFTSSPEGLAVTVPEAETESATVPISALPALSERDTVVLINHTTGEHRCGAVQAGGRFRVAVPSDAGDPLEFRAYAGVLPTEDRTGCSIPEGATPLVAITTLDRDVHIGGLTWTKGSELRAFTEGFGMRRATPELRRMLGIAQVALDSADPMNWAPYWEQHRSFTYGTGETANSRVLLIPSIGDPGVPIGAGIALARAAGFIEYDTIDPRYGKSQNQVLIDEWAVEGLSRTKRFTNSKGEGVLKDIDHLASITNADDGFDVPRLDPPLRLVRERNGGVTGVVMPMLAPEGKHGFVGPNPDAPFDLGTLLANMLGRFAATSGRELGFEACQVDSSCPWIPPLLE
jgi:pimeloyl-ACP methyl ester carboxylesterase